MNREAATEILIAATTKGETGYLTSWIDLDFRIHAGVTLDRDAADHFDTVERAERYAHKLAARFDRLEVITEEVAR